MIDCAIVGGGVIGLSVAYELAKRGRGVTLFDKHEPGREASWAGAGILPTAATVHGGHSFDCLRQESAQLHAVWANDLRNETGIDNEYWRCGGIYVARSRADAALLRADMIGLPQEGIEVTSPTLKDIVRIEPALQPAVEAGTVRAAFFVPNESQLRNTLHLQALQIACEKREVDLVAHTMVTQIQSNESEQCVDLTTQDQQVYQARKVCICAGPWSQKLLAQMGHNAAIVPIRGQMLLFRCRQRLLSHIINEGNRYIVPRQDGHVLVGASEEETGFVKEDNPEVISQLKAFAFELITQLKSAELKATWTGLRPASLDGLPLIGPVPGHNDVFVATGHFRSGLFLSPATAVRIADLMTSVKAPKNK